MYICTIIYISTDTIDDVIYVCIYLAPYASAAEQKDDILYAVPVSLSKKKGCVTNILKAVSDKLSNHMGYIKLVSLNHAVDLSNYARMIAEMETKGVEYIGEIFKKYNFGGIDEIDKIDNFLYTLEKQLKDRKKNAESLMEDWPGEGQNTIDLPQIAKSIVEHYIFKYNVKKILEFGGYNHYDKLKNNDGDGVQSEKTGDDNDGDGAIAYGAVDSASSH